MLGAAPLIATLARALAHAEALKGTPGAAPNSVWTALEACAVEPRALSAFVYHLTKGSVRAQKGGPSSSSVPGARQARKAAALYLALMQLPGARSHLFNEFTFRSVCATIPLVVAAPRVAAACAGQKRKRLPPSAPAGGGLSRAERAERRGLGPRKSARADTASSPSAQPLPEEPEAAVDAEAGVPARGMDSTEVAAADSLEGAEGDTDADDDLFDNADTEAPPVDADKSADAQCVLTLLEQARGLAEGFSLQTAPESHEQLARVAVETALALPASSAEASTAWACARALVASIHGLAAEKAVLKQLMPAILRPGAPAVTVKSVVGFVDSCLRELPPPVPPPPPAAATTAAAGDVDAQRMPPPSVPGAGGSSVEGGKAKSGADAMADDAESKTDAERLEHGVYVLCQQLCVRVGDRAPTRGLVCAAVLGVVDVVRGRRGVDAAQAFVQQLARFLARLARHAKPALRLHACELASLLLNRQPEEQLLDVDGELLVRAGADASVAGEGGDAAGAEDGGDSGVRVRLLSTLLKRCSDKLPSVRAKALAGFASALQHPPTARQVLVLSVRVVSCTSLPQPCASVFVWECVCVCVCVCVFLGVNALELCRYARGRCSCNQG